MIAGWHMAGDTIMMEQMPIMGGYAGGPEETAICDVATTIASYAIFNSDIHLDGPIHIRWGTTTTKETLQVAAHAACALDTNTDVLLGNQYYSMGGPCTEFCLLEVAAQSMTDTASGRELVSGNASAKGVSVDHTTGMEARVIGEVAMATCGMDTSEVNSILSRLVPIYDRNYNNAPMGKRFQDCYDLRTITPLDEYMDVYESAVDTLSACGLEF